MKKISMGFIALLFLAACTNTKKMSVINPTLFQKWNLISLNGDSITPDNKPVYIEFHDSAARVTGNGGCNRFFSNYTLHGDMLNFKPIASTKMACIDEKKNKTETDFFRTLDKVTSYKFENGLLVMLTDGQPVAVFTESHAVPDAMAGHWELFYITGRKIAFNGLYPERKPSLTFTEGQSEFSGFSSCNAITGKFRDKKGLPLFKPGLMTLMACPGEGEQVFMNEFKKVDDYQVNGDTLTLFYKSLPAMKFMKTQIPATQ